MVQYLSDLVYTVHCTLHCAVIVQFTVHCTLYSAHARRTSSVHCTLYRGSAPGLLTQRAPKAHENAPLRQDSTGCVERGTSGSPGEMVMIHKMW